MKFIYAAMNVIQTHLYKTMLYITFIFYFMHTFATIFKLYDLHYNLKFKG